MSVIAILVVALIASMLVVVIFPDRFAADLPGWARPWFMRGWVQVVLQLEPDGGELAQAVEESIRISKSRLNDLGTGAVVEKQETDRILVQLPRSADVSRSIAMLTRRGKLEFRLIDTSMTAEQAIAQGPPRRSEVLYDANKKPYLVDRRTVVSSRDLVDAQPGFDPYMHMPVVNFRFNASGARTFGQVTQENVGRPFAMVFDREVLSAPVIREPILGGRGQISGAFTVEQANDMAILLRAGELPGRLTVIEQRTP